MTGIGLIIVFILAIALMIFCISKLKIHPFLAIMAISLVFGLIAGIPLVNTTDADGNTNKAASAILYKNGVGTLFGQDNANDAAGAESGDAADTAADAEA